MKKYEYEEVVMRGFFGSHTTEHHNIINRRAAEGWRYVGFVPLEVTQNGVLQAFDLIFEKDVEETE